MITRECATSYLSWLFPYLQGLGKPGYYLFNFALLMTLYGACIGTMVVMTDFLSSLPIMTSNPTGKRYLMQVLLTVVAIVLCMLKDPSLLVSISSLGLVALVVSYVLLFIYCFMSSKLSWETSYLYPLSLKDFLNNFGVFAYSLGFTLYLFSQLVHPAGILLSRNICVARPAVLRCKRSACRCC